MALRFTLESRSRLDTRPSLSLSLSISLLHPSVRRQVSLIFGNAITILVFIFAGISGANINPAVSWSLMLTRKITPVRCLVYSVAQVLGAIAGAGMVRIMTPTLFDAVNGGANQINRNAAAQEALGVEFGCTFLLVLTVMAATDSTRAEKNKHIGAIAPIVIGLAVTAAHFIAIPVDNCSINPGASARTAARRPAPARPQGAAASRRLTSPRLTSLLLLSLPAAQRAPLASRWSRAPGTTTGSSGSGRTSARRARR